MIEALKERETLAELAKRFESRPNHIRQCKREKNTSKTFEGKKESESEADKKEHFAKIGKLEMENNFLKKFMENRL